MAPIKHFQTVGLALLLATPLACSQENREVEAPDPPSEEPLIPAGAGMGGTSNATQGIPQTETNTPSESGLPLDPGSAGTGGTLGTGSNFGTGGSNIGTGGNSKR
jgi:hypothetical protein